jgi:hypothetical protein
MREEMVAVVSAINNPSQNHQRLEAEAANSQNS